MRPGWLRLAVLLPALLGFLVTALVAGGLIENHRVYLAARLAFAAPLAGLLLSLAIGLVALAWWRADRSVRRRILRHQSLAAEERRRFLQRLDHELKNPLTAIRASLANLAWLEEAEARQEALSSADAQVLRLGRLTADLRKVAELETRALESAAVDMGQLLREVVDSAGEAPAASRRPIHLSVPQAPWPLPSVQGDPDLLFLAVHNLVANALKFTEPGDTIEVRAYEDGARLVIEVADTGPGIPSEEASQVWAELYRGRTARGLPGSGLGLALVRAITERHGGQIALRSRPGQGSVFSLQLPIRRA